MLPDTQCRPLAPEVAREVETLMAVEPRVAFPDEPSVAQITKADIWVIRGLIAGGIAAVAAFFWFVLVAAQPGALWLYWPLVAFFSFTATLSLYEWFCYLGVSPRRASPTPKSNFSVDVLTTWCPGEPKLMVVATLKSILRMRFPHTTYLCDEGDDPALREICAQLGIRHATREKKVGAKAGNINNALRDATGDIAVVMDPDHEAAPYFLDRVVGFFEDPKIGFVQHAQAYYNQCESLIARGAAEQTYHFYGPLQTGMHGHGTTQAIGANCAFRRAALDSIGGHATGLAEDMATTLKLYAKGWTSVYTPEILSRGQVPATFPSYCKQQLKWACGVWDILIESFPAAFGRISWKNRLHYIMNGLFYCRGVFFLIGALIPITALLTGQVPLEITVEEFLMWFGPMLAAQILIRQAAQRWLLEPEERGLHLVGGFLMNSVWLINLRGVISAILRVKIPYIPTPKDDAAANSWALAMPNIVLITASAAAIAFGLSWDWSPYSGLMAAFALANITSLGIISIAAQQKLLASLSLGGMPARVVAAFGRGVGYFTGGLCWTLRRQAALLAVIAVAAFGYAVWPHNKETQLETLWAQMERRQPTNTGGFMLGAYEPDMDRAAHGQLDLKDALASVDKLQSVVGQDLSIISLFYEWNDLWDGGFPTETLKAIQQRGSVPMITWMPRLSSFKKAQTDPRYYKEERVFDLIVSGKFDRFLDDSARKFRDLGGPVLIRFAHEMDNPQYPWSKSGGNTSEDFIAAWRYLVDRFKSLGVENVLWVWSPWNEANLEEYYPGAHYVDFIGLTLLNYGTTQGYGSWHSFNELYDAFYSRIFKYHAPILLAEFGTTNLGGDREAWLSAALESISKRPEIAGAVLFNSDEDANWPAEWADASEHFPIKWSIAGETETLASAFGGLANVKPVMPLQFPTPAEFATTAPRRIIRSSDGWDMVVDGRPFQIKGVAYAAGEGWRSASVATRWTIERDFADIAAMGANTVRQYSIGWPNTNVLRAANANDLKVMMGVWLDPLIDYVNDTSKLDAIEREVLTTVERYKDHPSVLAWNVGNETWGQLKHKFSGPRLVWVRQAYLGFVDRLARSIKAIDKTHPVMTSLEFTNALPGALTQLENLAPSIDAVGINAYYPIDLDWLEGMIDDFDPVIPVFLSEFGPIGYWDRNETRWSAYGFPLEPSDAEKARQYVDAWTNHVAGVSHSIGGVAFTWRDRLEGSPTWFGLTDEEGRKKPAYYALAQLWTGGPLQETALPKNLTIVMSESFAPRTAAKVKLAGSDWTGDCMLEWHMIDEMTLKTLWRRNSQVCSGDMVRLIDVPDRPGRYRLIARISRNNSVTTASHPVFIEQSVSTAE